MKPKIKITEGIVKPKVKKTKWKVIEGEPILEVDKSLRRKKKKWSKNSVSKHI